MSTALYLVSNIASVLLLALELCMFARAVLSFFPMEDEEGPIQTFLVAVTEPFIMPVRSFLEQWEFFASCPIDLSFMVTFLILSVVQTLL